VTEVVLAVDGGNSKTDLALVDADGGVLGFARGPGSSPDHLGVDGCLDLLSDLREQAGSRARPDVAELLLAGVDFPDQEQRVSEAALARGWPRRTTVRNDTFAVLRAGSEGGWGVAVVCGAGINCVGVSPDGRHARFPSLGTLSGDWGGGYGIGEAAVWSAARSEDGRGPKTSLETAVPAHFGLTTPLELGRAMHEGRIAECRLVELAPLVLERADTDSVAAEIVERLVSEVAALARVALSRLGLEREPVEVILGGGLLQTAADGLLTAIEQAIAETAPEARVRPTRTPAIVGAALLGLDAVGAGTDAQERLRSELGGETEA
jgi:N-acetylglucosamine kinase-like BadF-type ATPase